MMHGIKRQHQKDEWHCKGAWGRLCGCHRLIFADYFLGNLEPWLSILSSSSNIPSPSEKKVSHKKSKRDQVLCIVQQLIILTRGRSPLCSRALFLKLWNHSYNSLCCTIYLVSYFICSSLYLLIPYSCLSPPHSLSPMITTSLFSMSVSPFLFCYIFVCIILQIPHIRSDQSLSHVWLFATPWIAARQASLSINNSQSSPRLTSIKSVMPSSHLILCRPLLLLPPIPPSIRVNSSHEVAKVLEFQL